jgi:hypothetical protein
LKIISKNKKNNDQPIGKLRSHLELMKIELDYTQKGIKEFKTRKKSEWEHLDLIEGKSIKELKQHEKELAKEISTTQKKIKTKSKTLLITEVSLLPVVFLLVMISGVGSDLTNGFIQDSEGFKSRYFVENLRGDTMATWKSWRLLGTTMNVNILAPNNITPDKIEIVKNAITSMEAIEVDNSINHKGPKGTTSLYYLGWQGALNDVAKKTETRFQLPLEFHVMNSDDGEGDIVITLTTLRDTDGYTGYTKSIVEGNEILKSFITIYDTANLDEEELSTITRHEFGHALGLGHSTAPEDLMAPTIDLTTPLISECNVDAIVDLYNGADESQTVCEI